MHLYAEKPSFRMVVAGETAFLGSIDCRDTAGEIPLVEVRRRSDAPSLHAAARAHFLRAWGDSLPVRISATTTVNAPVDQGSRTPVPRSAPATA